MVSSLSYKRIFLSIDTTANEFYHLVRTEPTSLYNLGKNFNINGLAYGNDGLIKDNGN